MTQCYRRLTLFAALLSLLCCSCARISNEERVPAANSAPLQIGSTAADSSRNESALHYESRDLLSRKWEMTGTGLAPLDFTNGQRSNILDAADRLRAAEPFVARIIPADAATGSPARLDYQTRRQLASGFRIPIGVFSATAPATLAVAINAAAVPFTFQAVLRVLRSGHDRVDSCSARFFLSPSPIPDAATVAPVWGLDLVISVGGGGDATSGIGAYHHGFALYWNGQVLIDGATGVFEWMLDRPYRVVCKYEGVDATGSDTGHISILDLVSGNEITRPFAKARPKLEAREQAAPEAAAAAASAGVASRDSWTFGAVVADVKHPPIRIVFDHLTLDLPTGTVLTPDATPTTANIWTQRGKMARGEFSAADCAEYLAPTPSDVARIIWCHAQAGRCVDAVALLPQIIAPLSKIAVPHFKGREHIINQHNAVALLEWLDMISSDLIANWSLDCALPEQVEAAHHHLRTTSALLKSILDADKDHPRELLSPESDALIDPVRLLHNHFEAVLLTPPAPRPAR